MSLELTEADVGKFFRCRDGRKALLYRKTQKNPTWDFEYSFIILYDDPYDDEVLGCDSDGRGYDKANSFYDLIAPWGEKTILAMQAVSDPMLSPRPTTGIKILLNTAMELSGSQKRLATKIGVRPGTVCLWLRGGVQPSADNLRRLENLVFKENAYSYGPVF